MNVTRDPIRSQVTATFDQKEKWFRDQIAKLQVPYEEGHIRLLVTRDNLLLDSMEAIESIRKEDMQKIFRFEFQNEAGVDAGGVAREWFHLVSKGLFDPAIGLFTYSAINQMCMQINPYSGLNSGLFENDDDEVCRAVAGHYPLGNL